jgi:hypothetical protein
MSDYHRDTSLLDQSYVLETNLWEHEVVPRLPDDLEDKAQTHGAFQRQRGVRCATDVLRALLAYVLDQHSFRSLGAWAVLGGVANLSDRAWSKRLQRSRAWLLWLLNALLPTPNDDPHQSVPDHIRRVLLVDATRLRQEGGCGDDWRVHTAYDLLHAALTQVTVTDARQGEHLGHFTLESGDLVIADAGLGTRRNIARARQQDAHVILRSNVQNVPLEDDQGQQLDQHAWLRRKHGGAVREQAGYVVCDGQRYAVRMVATRLPPQQAAANRARKRRIASRKQRPLSPEALLLAEWIVVVTTLPTTAWSADEVLRLYRARWQVELFFKRLKQILQIRPLRCRRQDTAEATVRTLLVAWLLLEQHTRQLTELLQRMQQGLRNPHPRCSSSVRNQWVLSRLSLTTLRQQVRGQWSAARLRACLPALMRYLCRRPHRRGEQAHAIEGWLTRRLQDEPERISYVA